MENSIEICTGKLNRIKKKYSKNTVQKNMHFFFSLHPANRKLNFLPEKNMEFYYREIRRKYSLNVVLVMRFYQTYCGGDLVNQNSTNKNWQNNIFFLFV